MATNRDSSIGSLVGSIVGDVQDLVRQEIALARQEVREEVNTAKDAGIKFGIAGGVLGVGGLLLILGIAGGLAQLLGLPTWAGYLIVGVVLAIVGYIMLSSAQKQAKQISPVPRKTVETMKENVEWIKDRTTSDKT